jgi:conjugal transfer pilin signal peptidase TrbI
MSTIATTPVARFIVALRRLRFGAVDLAAFLIRHWLVTLLVLGLYGTAWHMLYVNLSPSLPYTLIWLERGKLPLRGDLMVYRCCANSEGITPPNLLLFKKVAGLEGDIIEVHDRTVYVNGMLIGMAKERASTGRKLNPILYDQEADIQLQLIPPGFYFAQGLTEDSFDSRYRQSGLVARSAIVGVAHPIF